MRSRSRSIRTILLGTISALTVLVVMLALQASYREWRRLEEIRSLKEASVLGDKLFDLDAKLAIERGITFSMLYATDQETMGSLRPQLEASRKETDEASHVAFKLLEHSRFQALGIDYRKEKETFAGIQALRQHIDKILALPFEKRDQSLPDQWFKESTQFISQTRAIWSGFIKYFVAIDPVVTLHMRFKYTLALIMEYAGKERDVIGRLIVENIPPTTEAQMQLLQWRGITTIGWQLSEELVEQGNLATVKPILVDTESHYETIYNMGHDIFYVPYSKQETEPYPISADMWLELSTQVSESFIALKDVTVKETRHYVENLEAKAQRGIVLHMGLLVATLILCYASFYIVTHRVITPINTMVEALLAAIQGEKVNFVPANTNEQDEMDKLSQVLGVFRQNVDTIKRTSTELERYTKDLERSNKELDDFAYIASHDLKEPLRGIHNHSRFLLEDNEDKLDEESIGRLNRLIYLSQRMEKLVNDLLYFSRLGRQDLAVQPTDMNEVIHDIGETMDVFLHERKATILIPHPLPVMTCDKTRITEAFRNLITNAVKYNDKSEKTVEIGFLEQYYLPDGKGINSVFYVRDNGRGIAKEFYDEVFRIFKRLQSNRGQGEEGTGAGLTFVKKIVERHGGEIWLESEPGQGTTFYFSLGGASYDTKAAA